MKYYRNYLPNYLGGPNIDRHSSILEEADESVYCDLALLEMWCSLPRPVTIQREAISLDNIHMIIRVDIPQSIKKITITGEYQYTQSYDEEDIMTTTTIDFYLRGSTNSLKNPDITVTVETYDVITYTKSYPENDTAVGDSYDHDEFLDRIGNLLGIPRRIYDSYSFEDARKSTPPYFGKTVVGGVVQSCTEDDYYYQQRLQYYLENYNKMPLPILLLRTIYGYEHVTELNTSTIRDDSVWQYIKDEINDNIPVPERPCTYVFLVNRENYVNIQSLSDAEKIIFLEKYIPITRQAYLLPQILTTTTIYPFDFPKGYAHNFTCQVIDEKDGEVKNRDIIWTLDDRIKNGRTNNSGEHTVTYENVPMGYHSITADHLIGGGFEASSDRIMYKSYIDDYTTVNGNTPVTLIDGTALLTQPISTEYMGIFMSVSVSARMYYISLVGRNNSTDEWQEILRTDTFTSSGSTVVYYNMAVDLDAEKMYIGNEEVEVTRISNVTDYREVALQITSETEPVRQSNAWITHYKPYDNQENIVLDEFTLRYDVIVPNTGSTYEVTLGEQGYGFTADIKALTSSRLCHLEYKFLNYKCYFYINDEYTGMMYDFEEDILTTNDFPGETPVTTQCPTYQYTRNPRLTISNEAYLIPITDFPGIPAHEGEVTPQITSFDVSYPTRDGVPVDFTTLMYRAELIRLDLSAVTDSGKPLNGRVHLTVTGYPDGTVLDANMDSTIKILNGAWHNTLPGLPFEGVLNVTAQIPEGWRRNPSNTIELTIPIVAAPMHFYYYIDDDDYADYLVEDDDSSPARLSYYTSINQTIPLCVELIPDSHPWNMIDDPLLTPTDVTLHASFQGNALPDIEIVNGEGVVEVPCTLKDTTTTLDITWDGNEVYAPATTSIPVTVIKTQLQLDLTYPDIVQVDTPFTIEYYVYDQYGDPVSIAIKAANSLNGINESSTTDATGHGSITINAPSTPKTLNIQCTCPSNSYGKSVKKTIQITSYESTRTPQITLENTYLTKGVENIISVYVTFEEDGTPVTTGRVMARVRGNSIKDSQNNIIYECPDEYGHVEIPYTPPMGLDAVESLEIRYIGDGELQDVRLNVDIAMQ